MESVSQKSASHALFVLSLGFILHDLQSNMLGDKNRWFISFIDSICNCLDYRAQKLDRCDSPTSSASSSSSRGASVFHMKSERNSWGWCLRLLITSLFLKFGASTISSICMDETPVWLKSSRHVLAFLGALALVQLSPQDIVYSSCVENSYAKFILFLGRSLYRVRKVVFIVEHTLNSPVFSLFIIFIVIDGNATFRNIEYWFSFTMPSRIKSNKFILKMFLDDCYVGFRNIFTTSFPLMVVSLIMWHCAKFEEENNEFFVSIYFLSKLLVLLFFWFCRQNIISIFRGLFLTVMDDFADGNTNQVGKKHKEVEEVKKEGNKESNGKIISGGEVDLKKHTDMAEGEKCEMNGFISCQDESQIRETSYKERRKQIFPDHHADDDVDDESSPSSQSEGKNSEGDDRNLDIRSSFGVSICGTTLGNDTEINETENEITDSSVCENNLLSCY